MAKIRVFLTDDHTLFRQGIRTLLAAEPDIEIAGESGTAGDAVEKAEEVRPDVVLMDISMPGMSSFQAIREVQRGGSYMSPKMLAHLVDDFRSRARSEHPVPRFDTLTGREKEVLKLLAEGNSVKEIAGD